MQITQWLTTFKSAWIQKDIDAVMALFADDVEYWETPHRRLLDKNEVRKEWQAIHTQDTIHLILDEFNSVDNTHAVRWHLRYTQNTLEAHWSGVYLIKLDESGLCTFFHQTGEQKI